MPGNAMTSARWSVDLSVDCYFECKAFGSIAIYSQLIQIAWAERICFHFPDNPEKYLQMMDVSMMKKAGWAFETSKNYMYTVFK